MNNSIILLLSMIFLSIPLYTRVQNVFAEWDRQDMQLFEDTKKEHNMDDAETYQVLGVAFLQQRYTDKATICFERAVQLDSELYFSWYHLGLLNMDAPESYFKKAIEIDPGFYLSYYWLASYYKQSDKKQEAQRYFKLYLETVDRNDSEEQGRIKVAEDALR